MAPRQAGFTLIEAMIAAGLLVTVSLGTAQLFAIAIAQNIAAREQLVMGVVAAAKLEDLAAAVAGGSAAVSPADALDRDVAGCADTIVEGGSTYLRRWRISEVPGYGAEAYAIAVRVRRSVPGGGDVVLTTVRGAGAP